VRCRARRVSPSWRTSSSGRFPVSPVGSGGVPQRDDACLDAQSLGMLADQQSARHTPYDLRRLHLYQLIERIPRMRRYRVTDFGKRAALLFSKAHIRRMHARVFRRSSAAFRKPRNGPSRRRLQPPSTSSRAMFRPTRRKCLVADPVGYSKWAKQSCRGPLYVPVTRIWPLALGARPFVCRARSRRET